MGKISEKIIVEIENIEVDQWYYSYDYWVYRNGELLEDGQYSDSHNWADDQEFIKSELKRGLAVQNILERIEL